MNDTRRNHTTIPGAAVIDRVSDIKQSNDAPASADTADATPVEERLVDPPTRPIRPLFNERPHSAHVYALDASPVAAPVDVYDPESGLGLPQRACITRRGSINWPIESVVTVGPSRGIRKSQSFVSQDSSGEPVNEIEPPLQLLNSIETHGPGTYKCTITDVGGRTRSITASAENMDGAETSDVLTYEVERVDHYDPFIATNESLQKLCEPYPLPTPEQSQTWLWLRYFAFSTYRRIFAIVVIANVIAIFCMVARCIQRPGSFTFADATTAVAANLFVGTLMRHEHCVNLIFRTCLSLPHWLPVGVRRLAAKVYSYGGIHSGCGISAFLWYLFFNVLVIKYYRSSDVARHSVAALTGGLDFSLFVLVATSHPEFRRQHHNAWEMIHRFCGWLAVVLVWVQLWIIAATEASHQHRNAGLIAIQLPAFWFLCGITLMIIYPWLRLRRVRLEVERLSNQAARLRFTNHQRRMAACVGTKLSIQPLLENHSFATIADPNGEKGYSIIVSAAGDWTKRIVNDPPKYLWKRGAPTIGVMRLAQLFKPIVVVATGSGIGPCMSFLQTHPGWPCRIVWSTRMPEVYYGASIVQSVLAADPNAVIIDTHKTGYGDLVSVCYAVYKASKAEAVVIISNQKVVDMVVFRLEQRNVPAFGPVFDS